VVLCQITSTTCYNLGVLPLVKNLRFSGHYAQGAAAC